MTNQSKIALYLFAIQCFWSIQSHQQPITLYCHGVCGDSSQINDYKDLMHGQCTALDFPDAIAPTGLSINRIIYSVCTKFGKANINLAKMYMGQGQDVETIKNEVDPEKHYILYGLCRGGAAIVNYIAQYNPKNIMALVLDEAPANMCDIIGYRKNKKKGRKVELTPIQKEKTFRFFFPAYPKNSKPPVENIASIINKDLIIFLSCTDHDSGYHFPQSTWNMYLGFKKAGFTNIYLCQLESPGQKAEGNNKKIYQQNLHSVYKKHNLPYNPAFAILTDIELNLLQPTMQSINKKLMDHPF